MRVVVTIPAYNEERTIAAVINGILEAVKPLKKGNTFSVLVVDDGSRDRTAAVASEAGADVVSHPRNFGLAETFRTEMKECLRMKADVIIHIDADGQYRATDIPRLLAKVDEGYDLVLGSRFLGTIEYMPWLKRWGNKAFSRVISNISGMRITDGQTGFRAFTSEVARELSMTSDHTYTQEQVIRAVKEGFKVVEVPAYFAKRAGKSRLISNPFEYAAKAWINIFRIYRDYKPLKFFGMVGGGFLFLGFVLGLFAAITWIVTGEVGGVPRVVLSGVLLMAGIQIILFGFLADMIRK